MSQYAKAQEYRLQDKLLKLGCEIIQYYGSRNKNKGDFLIKTSKGTQVRIDHKSTENEKAIRLQFEWLRKIERQNAECHAKDGHAVPVVTFSLKRHQGMYVLSGRLIKSLPLQVYTGKVAESVVLTIQDLNEIRIGYAFVLITSKFVYQLGDFVEVV